MWSMKTDIQSQSPFETFSDWFEEEKVPLPIFDDIQTVLPVDPLPVPVAKIDEVSYVLGHGHLTPPQSPPAVHEQTIYIVPQEPQYVTLLPSQAQFVPQPEPYVLAPPADLELEMAVVDEVVRGAAQQWEAWESSDTSSRSSDGTEDSDDPEWMPVAEPSKPSGRPTRKSRPYNPDDRRNRKKEQNKNAATRYRQKKKEEVSVILTEERQLEDKNSELDTKVQDLAREITYLKGLMRELFKAKGLLN